MGENKILESLYQQYEFNADKTKQKQQERPIYTKEAIIQIKKADKIDKYKKSIIKASQELVILKRKITKLKTKIDGFNKKIEDINNANNRNNFKYKPKTKEELKVLVKDSNIYLGDIDTSNIIDMSWLFADSRREDFSGIETWDTSKVIDMSWMFYYAINFNQLLNKWNTSNVINMEKMFFMAVSFNQPLDKWDTSKVTDMNRMFAYAKSFNQPLNSWDTSKVKYMGDMFLNTESFNPNYSPFKKTNKINKEEV